MAHDPKGTPAVEHTLPDASFYQSLVDKSPFGFAYHEMVYDTHGRAIDYRFLYVNSAFERITGLKAEEILGKKATTVIPHLRTTSVDWVALFNKLASSGQTEVFEEYSQGLGKWFKVFATSSSKDHFVSWFIDVSSEKEAIKKYEQSEKRYRGLVSSQTDLIVRIDTENRFTFVNDAYCRMFNKTREELLGKTFTPLVHEEDVAHTLEEMKKLYHPPYRARMVQRAMTGNGWRWLHWEDNAVLDEDGNIIEIQGVGRDITQLKEKEREVEQIKLQLETLLSEVPAVVYSYQVADGAIDLTYINRNVENILGFKPEDFVGNVAFWAECVHPDDLPGLQEKLSGASKETITSEYRFRDKQGHYHWLNDQQKFIREENGVMEYIGAWWDMTERKQAEDELFQQQQRLSWAQSFSGLGVWEYNLHTGQLYWSTECEYIFGLQKGTFEGNFDHFLNRVHPDDREYVLTVNEPILEHGAEIPLEYEHRILHESGQTRWVRESAGVVRGLDGAGTHLVGFIMDITRQKEAEEALEKQEKISQILENIDGTFWLLPANRSRILYGLQPIEKLYGVGANELKQSPDAMFQHVLPEDMVHLRQALAQARKSGHFALEYRVCTENNKHRWIEHKQFPVKNDTGEIIRLANLAKDITPRKHAELALQSAMHKAEESSRLKSTFLATISHELRTPLTSIIGFSDLLMSVQDNQEHREFASSIYKSATSFKTILDDILTMSNAEDGILNVKTDTFGAAEWVAQQEDLCQTLLKESGKQKTVSVQFSIDEKLKGRLITTDRQKFGIILSNLYRNALKFTESGHISINLNQENETHLMLSITDTGVGIPKEKQAIIFEFFRQAEQGFTRKYGGVGIGLSIAHKLATLLGGTLDVESEPEKGATFRLRIPVVFS